MCLFPRSGGMDEHCLILIMFVHFGVGGQQ